MKKTFTLLSLMATMTTGAFAGTVAIAPAPVAPEPVNPWASAFGVEAVAAFADQSMNPDLWGARLTFSMYKASTESFTHELNIGAGLLTGHNDISGTDVEVTQVPLTLGYNANYKLCDKVTGFAGAKIGANFFDVSLEEPGWKTGDNDWGWQWSVGTGIKYELRPNVDFILSYEFTRVYTNLSANMPYSNVNVGYHMVTAGLVFWF